MPRIVQFNEFGGPNVLRLAEVEIAEPGPTEARVRVGAIGLNRFEALFRSGNYIPTTFPSKIGAEAAGVVEAVGADVANLTAGDRVAALPGLSMERYGACGEKFVCPAEMLVKLADGQSLTQAAACWMQYVTAYALVRVAAIKAGDAVAITAASSSVGLAAIQIANAHGAVPIALTRGRAKAAALLTAGAAHVIATDEEDVAARLVNITGGVGLRVAFDAVGGELLPILAGGMAPEGIIISYGVLAGASRDFPLVQLLAKNLTLRGWSADILTQDPALRAEVVDYVNRGLASGALHPVIDRTFTFDAIADAYRYLESNAQFGKIVVATATAHE